MAQSFESRLRGAGCAVNIDDLRGMLSSLLARSHPTWNDEDLMHNPADALSFCEMVRQFEGCGMLLDELILRILSGTRKQALV